MVLILNGQLVSFNAYELSAFLSNHILAQEAYKFLSKTKQNITDNHNLIFLHQREKADVYYTDPAVSLIGTDDATTCHFVVLDCTNLGIVSAGHLDGAELTTEYFFDSFTSKLLNYTKRYERSCSLNNINHLPALEQASYDSNDTLNHVEVTVSIFGGFLDDSNYSNRLSCDILKLMSQSRNIKFRLQLCAITNLNNKIQTGFNFPIQYGAIYNIKSHEMIPADFSLESREPHHILRSTRFHISKLCDIYNPDRNELVLTDFEYQGAQNHSYYKQLKDASNKVLRRYSTSPKQEKDDYEEHLRSIYKFMYQHPDPSIFYDKSTNSIRYKCNPTSGVWEKV